MTGKSYRGRIAPSPTGFLHIGHAMTFWRAQERARAAAGNLILRIEDLDVARCREEFRKAAAEDLEWFGLRWEEGPDIGGAHAPYRQSERRTFYRDAWERLHAGGFIYPCRCSRKDVLASSFAPHDENEEPVYPGTCRPSGSATGISSTQEPGSSLSAKPSPETSDSHWRFQVPDGETLRFIDGRMGEQVAVAGKDFGDFVVWRRDNVPAYQLAVVVDDGAMDISEVVRGEDLLLSTFRQLLLYRALGLTPPEFYHTPLVTDDQGQRLAKRHAALSLRELRQSGVKAEEIRARFAS